MRKNKFNEILFAGIFVVIGASIQGIATYLSPSSIEVSIGEETRLITKNDLLELIEKNQQLNATIIELNKSISQKELELDNINVKYQNEISEKKENIQSVSQNYDQVNVSSEITSPHNIFELQKFSGKINYNQGTGFVDTYGTSYEKSYLLKNADVEYLLNKKYTKLKLDIAIQENDCNFLNGKLKIYSDNQCIYEKTDIDKKTKPFTIEIDLSNCDFLKLDYSSFINTSDGNKPAYLIVNNQEFY